MIFSYNPVDKPKHRRNKRKRGRITAITDKVRKECDRRAMEKWNSPVPCCERCGRNNRTAAHMENASQLGPGNVPWNVCNLCGTHGTQGCHDWADNTREGMEWKKNKRAELLEYYATVGREWVKPFVKGDEVVDG